ncbi:hypothetical protein NQ094_18015 [Enterobacter kobei]|nr:hypothetical protein [Enterobacter kobei]
MFAGKKSAQIREILISESAWEEMTCLFAPSLGYARNNDYKIDNVTQKDTADKVISLQLMMNMENGFLPYVRVGRTDAYNSSTNDNFYRAGLEFWF